jgi:hypothetical protein
VSQKFTKVFTAFLDHHKPDGANIGGDPPVLPGVVIPPVPPPVVANPPVVQPVANPPDAQVRSTHQHPGLQFDACVQVSDVRT